MEEKWYEKDIRLEQERRNEIEIKKNRENYEMQKWNKQKKLLKRGILAVIALVLFIAVVQKVFNSVIIPLKAKYDFIQVYGREMYDKYGVLNPKAVTVLSKLSEDVCEKNGIKTEDGNVCFTFGSYEQDDVVFNGQEPAEWVILDVKGNSALVISKYVIDCMPYNSDVDTSVIYENENWETQSYNKNAAENNFWKYSKLRAWLNGEFYESSFTAAEQQRIKATALDLEISYYANSEKDYIFLLSTDEANEYFSNDEERMCLPTIYVADIWNGKTAETSCSWWLRTSGTEDGKMAYVSFEGSVDEGGNGAEYGIGIRPAMWVELNG